MHSLHSTVYRHLSTLAFFDVRDKQLLSSEIYMCAKNGQRKGKGAKRVD